MKLKALMGLIILTGSIVAQDSTRVVKLKTFWNLDAETNSFFQNSKVYSFLHSKYIDVEEYNRFNKGDSYLSFAVEINSKNSDNFHELELKKIRISSRDNKISYTTDSVNYIYKGEEQVNLEASFNYEYNFQVLKKSKKISYYVGVGANPYVISYQFYPELSTDFPYSVTQLGVGLSVAPRMKFRLNKKIGFEMKMQAEMLNFENIITKNEAPLLTFFERKRSDSYLSAFGNGRVYSRMSFGINYKI